jgi:hypothetical protein
MSEQWQYQLRLYLADELAEAARRDAGAPVLGPLPQTLEKHAATMKCQLDAFSDYVAQAEANGIEDYPLYEWTKAIIEDSIKRAKHLKAFALHVKGQDVYAKEEADALEADLQPLVMVHGSHVCPGTTQTPPIIPRCQNAFASLRRN